MFEKMIDFSTFKQLLSFFSKISRDKKNILPIISLIDFEASTCIARRYYYS